MAKQTKADKAFIAKIATIGISTGASAKANEKTACPDCGAETQCIATVPVFGHPKANAAKLFYHGPPPESRRGAQEISLSA
jgi:hypothetical protein